MKESLQSCALYCSAQTLSEGPGPPCAPVLVTGSTPPPWAKALTQVSYLIPWSHNTRLALSPSRDRNPICVQTLIHVHSFLLSTCLDFSCHLTRFLIATVTRPSGGASHFFGHGYWPPLLPPTLIATDCLLWSHLACWSGLCARSVVKKKQAFTSNSSKCYLLAGCPGANLYQRDSLVALLRSPQPKYGPQPIVLGIEITSQACRERKEGREGRKRGNTTNIFPFPSKCRAACEYYKLGVKSAFILEAPKHQTTNPALRGGGRGK